jgi:hypothetical protein
MLKVAGNEENEFVRNYLQQRQKLLSQQLEQKKRFEGKFIKNFCFKMGILKSGRLRYSHSVMLVKSIKPWSVSEPKNGQL